jgi:putative PIG3 family NAD(P)H quinone oxidoreductase
MRHITISQFGGPEVLQTSTGSTPSPADGEVLIQVAAAGINRPDVVQRQGHYPAPAGASPIPGLEVAGTVVALGAGAHQFKEGDSVCALLTGGGYAEYATAAEGQCLPIPKGWSMTEAASLPENFFTVWSNVFDRGGLQAGQTFLTHGGSGGIGISAIQLAKAMGATVYATAGSEEKCRACEAFGADQAINYQQQDFVEVIKQATAKAGVDVILDMVGGDYINRNISIAAMDGSIVSIGFLQGSKTEVNFMPVMLKRLQLTGSTLRARSVAFKTAIAKQLHKQVWPLLEAGRIKPAVHTVLPLEQAAEGHRLMELNQHIGKIMLEI